MIKCSKNIRTLYGVFDNMVPGRCAQRFTKIDDLLEAGMECPETCFGLWLWSLQFPMAREFGIVRVLAVPRFFMCAENLVLGSWR